MASRRSPPKSPAAVVEHLRQRGLARHPGAHLKSPWPGHLDLAVADKTFAYLSAPGEPAGVSLKLPLSASIARDLPGAQPTAYGLGKSGWVTMPIASDGPPVEQLELWLDESYRAQAPKKLLAQFAASTVDAARATKVKKAKK